MLAMPFRLLYGFRAPLPQIGASLISLIQNKDYCLSGHTSFSNLGLAESINDLAESVPSSKASI
jgi:hypothetical protein